MLSTAWDTYAEQLIDQGHGYPLWDPEPTGNGEVEIGDIGFIRRGRFHRLFNARYTADHPLNETWGVPDDFEPLHIGKGFLVEKQFAITSESLHSSSFTRLAVGTQAQALSTASANIRFQCVDDRGALLVLPTKHAISQELLETVGVYKYIQQNHASWYQFATEKVGVLLKKEDIVFVNGWTKSSRWSVGAFVNGGKAVELSLSVGYEAHANATFAISSTSASSSSWFQNSGPTPVLVDEERPPQNHRGRAHRRGQARGSPASAALSQPVQPLDQCVFLRFCQCKERLRGILPSLLPKVIQAGAGPRDDKRNDGGDGDAYAPPSTEDQEELCVDSCPQTPPWYNPVECLLNHILESSDASIAIASTTDVATIARSEHVPLRELPSYLESQRPDVEVGEAGLGTLALCTTEPSDGIRDFFYVLPCNLGDVGLKIMPALGFSLSSDFDDSEEGDKAVITRLINVSRNMGKSGEGLNGLTGHGNLACKYLMDTPLYTSSYRTIMQAIHLKTGHRYACKMVHSELVDEVDFLRSHSKGHPSIVSIHDVLQIQDRCLIFLEWCSGGTLEDRLRVYGPHHESGVVRIVRVVLEVLKYLHSNGLIHGGLALHHVLFRSQGADSDVVVAGFSHVRDVRRLRVMHPEVERPGGTAKNEFDEAFTNDIRDVTAIAVCLLSGYIPPKHGLLSREQILQRCSETLASSAQSLSDNAKDFIAACLNVHQTADKAAKHPWLAPSTPRVRHTPNGSRAASRSSSRVSGRRFDARRQFRKAVFVMVAMSRMRHAGAKQGSPMPIADLA